MRVDGKDKVLYAEDTEMEVALRIRPVGKSFTTLQSECTGRD